MSFFQKIIQNTLVYIECINLKTDEAHSGSGVVFAYQGNAKDGWLPLILTARHVIEGSEDSLREFRLTRFSWEDAYNPKHRTAVFRTGGKDPRSPEVRYYNGQHADELDVGFIRGPLNCDDGKSFFDVGDDSMPLPGQVAPIVSEDCWMAEGSRVAWAGFPAIIQKIAGRPTPAYYEGSVSSLILRPEFPLYVLDGHNTFGVSGGPLWAYYPHLKSPRVCGCIHSYQPENMHASLPGFVLAAPIQPVWNFLTKNWNAKIYSGP